MELYLLRHADAVEIGAPGVRSDAERYLSDKGRADCAAAAPALAWLVERFDYVLASPLVRARETAELCLPGAAVTEEETLAGYPPEELFGALARLPGRSTVIVVGHEPQLSLAVERLLGASSGEVAMKKLGLAYLTVDLSRLPQTAAQLHYLLEPRQLRRLGGPKA